MDTDLDAPFRETLEADGLRAFIAELEADGFVRLDDWTWEGPTRRSLVDSGHTTSDLMKIRIQPSWPYLPPLIEVPGITSWHADQERLCIWRADDNSQRWVRLQGLYARIDEWVDRAEDDFAQVENARNPEIYWQEGSVSIVGLVELNDLIGSQPTDGQSGLFHFVEAESPDGRRSPGNVFDLRPGGFGITTDLPFGIPRTGPNGQPGHRTFKGRWFYRSTVARPPRTFEELRDQLTDHQRRRLEKDLRFTPNVMFGLFWHNQAGPVGTVLLSMHGHNGPERWLVALRPRGRDELMLRAGPDAEVLQTHRVAVVGVGAIGSHVTEILARAGVGTLILIDNDLLWPANMIRHAAPPGTPAGMPKTTAMKEALSPYPWTRIETVDTSVWTLEQMRMVLREADLTIDATGHAGLAELFARVAHDEVRPFLSVALFRGGAVARVRRQAGIDDTRLLDRPRLDGYPRIPPLSEEVEYVGTETGCLAQVHNAPPASVSHAATLAVEVAIDFLTERYEQPDEIIEVVRTGEPPFNRLGRIRSEDLSQTVDVTETARDMLRQLAAQRLPNETGGILLGCYIDRRPVVTHAVEVEDAEATPSGYKVAKRATAPAVEKGRRHDPRIGYVGEWHSHTTDVGPSVLDRATMLSAAQDSAQPIVLLLTHPLGPLLGSMSAYVTSSAGLHSAEVCLTGDLPPTAEETS